MLYDLLYMDRSTADYFDKQLSIIPAEIKSYSPEYQGVRPFISSPIGRMRALSFR